MEFREVRSLVLLAELGNIQRVAEAVHLSPPGVHKHLKTLQEELGVPLYERAGRSLKLTEAAECILPYFRQMIAEHDTARRVLDEWKGVKRGLVRVGAGQIVATYLVPRVLEKFFSRYPGVNASIQAAPVRPLVERLSTGHIDLAFLAMSELHEEPDLPTDDIDLLFDVTNLEMVFVSGTPRPARRCSIKSLTAVPFVSYERELGINRVMEHYFAAVGFHPRVVVRCDYTETIKTMVQKVPGMSLLPLWAVEKEIKDRTLWLVKQQERPLSLKIVLASRKRRYAPPAVRALIDTVREYLAQRGR
ncbi:MAG TPA: LysR family transcriptional regulator [Verrucomicrobiae bacterium]|nr:LysR family transcriptional regulator [Verrucomicrobiae bacterium]